LTGDQSPHGSHKPKIDLGLGTGHLQVLYTVLEELKQKIQWLGLA
jgi:hypothetical protein